MNAKQIASLSAALALANGKRRERLADLSDVIRVIRLVAIGKDGAGLRRICGTVANSYSYRAPATTITAARVGDVVRVRVDLGNAAKVAGGGNGYAEGTKSANVRALLADLPPSDAILIPLASAKRAPKVAA